MESPALGMVDSRGDMYESGAVVFAIVYQSPQPDKPILIWYLLTSFLFILGAVKMNFSPAAVF